MDLGSAFKGSVDKNREVQMEAQKQSSESEEEEKDEISFKVTPMALENDYPFLFKIYFRVVGFYTVRWSETTQNYRRSHLREVAWYILWFSFPSLLLTLIAFWREDQEAFSRTIYNAPLSFYMGCFIVPGFQCYILVLVYTQLPTILLKFNEAPAVPNMSFWKKIRPYGKSYLNISNKNKIFLVSTAINTIIIGFSIIIWYWYMIIHVNWSKFADETAFFILVDYYMFIPGVSTAQISIIAQKLKFIYETICKELTKDQWRTVKKIKRATSDIVTLQEIFSATAEDYAKYSLTVSMCTYLICSVWCMTRILNTADYILYLMPVIFSFLVMAFMSLKVNNLMEQYEHLLNNTRKQLNTRGLDPKIHNAIAGLRDQLLQGPPQFVLYGDYRVGFGLLLTAVGFVISFSVLTDEIAGPDQQAVMDAVSLVINSSFVGDEGNALMTFLLGVVQNEECVMRCLTSCNTSLELPLAITD